MCVQFSFIYVLFESNLLRKGKKLSGIITDQPLKPVATNFLPKIKRPLECDFFDSEEEAECKKSDAGKL